MSILLGCHGIWQGLRVFIVSALCRLSQTLSQGVPRDMDLCGLAVKVSGIVHWSK